MSQRAEELALVEACLTGERRAHRDLVGRYHRPVRQAISFLGPARDGRVSGADIDDATQIAFMSFFANDARALRGWQGSASLSTYLRRIAQRVAIRHFSKTLSQHGRFRLDLDNPEADLELDRADVDLAPGAEERLSSREERAALRAKVLEALSERGRLYYDYLFVQELDAAAICALEDTNTNNVYQWKNRILRQARQVLKDAGLAGSTSSTEDGSERRSARGSKSDDAGGH